MSTSASLLDMLSSLDSEQLKTRSSLNLKKIEFIDGTKLNKLKLDAYDSLARNPLVGYGSILNSIENSIYSIQPESILRTNIQKYLMEENLYILELDKSYKFRPDIVSQIFYGNIEYFHLVLMVNGMKTFLEFIPEKYNHLILVFKPSILPSVLNI